MSKADLSEALVNAGGGTRRKVGPQPVQAAMRRPTVATGPQPSRIGTKPITVHFPKEVATSSRFWPVEQGTTLQTLVGEKLQHALCEVRQARDRTGRAETLMPMDYHNGFLVQIGLSERTD